MDSQASETTIVNQEEDNINQQEKPKRKYYTPAQKKAIETYKEKHKEEYMLIQKEAQKRFQQKRREYASKYEELLDSGLIEKLNTIQTATC